MTVDDESSIYVGGLPYSATEETLRRVFDVYGAVVGIKVLIILCFTIYLSLCHKLGFFRIGIPWDFAKAKRDFL